MFARSSQPFACCLLTSSLHVLKSKPSAPQHLPSSTWGAHIPRANVPRGSPPCRERKHSTVCIHSHQFTVDPPSWAFCPSLSPRNPHIWMHHSQKPLESYHGPPQKLSTPPISRVPTSQKTIYYQLKPIQGSSINDLYLYGALKNSSSSFFLKRGKSRCNKELEYFPFLFKLGVL